MRTRECTHTHIRIHASRSQQIIFYRKPVRSSLFPGARQKVSHPPRLPTRFIASERLRRKSSAKHSTWQSTRRTAMSRSMGGGEATGGREGMSGGDATGGGDATCGDGRRDGRRRGAAHVRARDACEGSCLWHVTASASSTSQRTSRTKAQEVVVDAGSEDPGSPEDLHLNRPRTKPGGALRKDHHACAEIRAYAERGSGQGRERAQELRRAASTSRWRGRS